MFTLSDIDVFTIGQIETAKNSILLTLDTNSVEKSVEQLQSLFSLMQTILEKYFTIKEVEDQKVASYNFYDLKQIILLASNKQLIRKICELSYTNYNQLIKKIGVAIPTTRSSFKKKLIEKLFSIAKKDNLEKFVDQFTKEYDLLRIKMNAADTHLNFFCYAQSKMVEYDLDSNNLIVGFARVGKSTLFLQDARRITWFRNAELKLKEVDRKLAEEHFSETHILFNAKQSFVNMIKSSPNGSVICSDEGYLTADRRESMSLKHIKDTQTINAYAYLNHVYFTLIQNLSDLEMRYVNKANTITVVVERGRALLFSREKNFALIRDFFGFDEIAKRPHLISGYDKGIYRLKQFPSYIGEVHWKKMDHNIFYKDYLSNKKKQIGTTIEIQEESRTRHRKTKLEAEVEELNEKGSGVKWKYDQKTGLSSIVD